MDPLFRLKQEAVEWREVEGEIVALDLQRSEYLSINASGTVMWHALTGGATKEALVAKLRERFEVDEEQASYDVTAFVADLEGRNLLEAQE